MEFMSAELWLLSCILLVHSALKYIFSIAKKKNTFAPKQQRRMHEGGLKRLYQKNYVFFSCNLT